jgi:hypothetical protein
MSPADALEVTQSEVTRDERLGDGFGFDPERVELAHDPDPHDVLTREQAFHGMEDPEVDQLSNAIDAGRALLGELWSGQPAGH